MDLSLGDWGAIAAILSAAILVGDKIIDALPDAKITSLHVYEQDEFLAVSVRVSSRVKPVTIKGIRVNGAKVAFQKSHASAYQLHCVEPPDDSLFSSVLPIDTFLKPFSTTDDFVFVVKPKPRDTLKVSFIVNRRYFRISRKIQYKQTKHTV